MDDDLEFIKDHFEEFIHDFDLSKPDLPSSSVSENKPLGGQFSSNDKAGLQEVDFRQVNNLIHEMSKNSRFYQNEEKKNLKTQKRIQQILKQKELIISEEDPVTLEKLEKIEAELEVQRDLVSTWCHVDMDAFYAAVEVRDNPSLKGKPIAVGGNSMLATSSYEARKFGVRSAMPGFIGKQLCPDLIIVPGSYEKYKIASKQTHEVFELFDPNFEPLSIDEASLNITKYIVEHPEYSSTQVAKLIQRKIFDITKLTCSIGIAPNKRLAKICANVNKPNGHFNLGKRRDEIIEFVQGLPIRKLSGIGKVREQVLNALGIATVKDLYLKKCLLAKLFAEAEVIFFLSAALGLGSSQHSEKHLRKSLSHQKTFAPTSDKDALMKICHVLSVKVADDLQRHQVGGSTITIAVKKSTFEVRTRAHSVKKIISSAEEIYTHASSLLSEELPSELRLIGVRVSSLMSTNDLNKTCFANFVQRSPQSLPFISPEKSEKIDSNPLLGLTHKRSSSAEKTSPTKIPRTVHKNKKATGSPSMSGDKKVTTLHDLWAKQSRQ